MIRQNCPPHQGRSQTVDPSPGKSAVRFRNLRCAAFQRKLDTSTQATLSELQPMDCENGRRFCVSLFSPVVCHVERSRDISYCSSRNQKRNKGLEIPPLSRNDNAMTGRRTRRSSKLIGVGNAARLDRGASGPDILGCDEILDSESAGVPHIQVERYQLAIEMQLRLVV